MGWENKEGSSTRKMMVCVPELELTTLLLSPCGAAPAAPTEPVAPSTTTCGAATRSWPTGDGSLLRAARVVVPDPGTGGSAAEELVVCPGRAAGADQMVMQSLAPFSSGCNRLILAGSARAAISASAASECRRKAARQRGDAPSPLRTFGSAAASAAF